MKTTMLRIRSALCRSLVLLLLLSGAGFSAAAAQHGPAGEVFVLATRCMGCHNLLTASNGQDVSMGFNWRSSMMGNSGRDPYWMAAVRRETLDHPAALDAIEDKCTVCHLPMARTLHLAEGGTGKAFQYFPGAAAPGPHAALASDGVSCAACHQVQDDKLGTPESFTGGYVIDVHAPAPRPVYGPFEVDAGRTRLMESASSFRPHEAGHVQSAEFCASCHTLFTHALDPEGNEAGVLPEQTPYLEWKHSSYPGEKTCQNCHMPVVEGEVSVSGVLPNPRSEVNQHIFRGGNFFMPRVLNKHRAELGTQALPQDLEATARSVEEHLGTKTAAVEVVSLAAEGDRLTADLRVTNQAGHKLPSAYPSRRAWLHVTVTDGSGRVLLESGAVKPDGFIQGNDNDLDGSRYEPHHAEITSPDQVQIYEDIMVDYAGEVTTGLLWGARYIKDNRLLPDGFDKATAPDDVAVRGRAAQDADFVGGEDHVRYSAVLKGAQGPFKVVAELWYQPIGFRWAMNLGEYETAESGRFLHMFEGMESATAALLARTEEVLR